MALIDLSYPHNWANLDKPIYFAIVYDPTESLGDMLLDNFESKEHQDFYLSIIPPQGLARMWIRRMGRLSPGNFTAQTISDLIVFGLKETVKDIIDPKIDVLEQTQRVMFYQIRKYVIATFTENSVLHILGLGKQKTRIDVHVQRRIHGF